MIKNLLLAVTLVSTVFTYGQYSQDFETTTLTPTTRTGDAAQATGVKTANPVKAGLNTSDNSFEITLTDTAPSWRWLAANNPGGTYGSAAGTFIKFKFLSVNETSVTIQLEPWLGGTNYLTEEQTFTGLTLNTWYEVEFDLSNAVAKSDGTTLAGAEPGYMGRLDFKFNATGTYDGDVYYIDDIEQGVAETLSSASPSFKNVGVYPNPTTGIINISDISNIPGDISISNVLGQVVKTVKAANTITISDLPQGIYFLQTGNQLIKKVIKK
ncbi:T9SS type A sorting domain-containing protein [Wenyingzhuangia aestuarii]|uniref:T9SS type A sorting domain-containing protein n=1 Tax=Wenyingzhuangia aestuarii TaxID=1647582 RepID=UPI00143C8005|nr:T9SS type A sorting domain-containing protein [Wenyingzhuangia aestuarii]NJB81860.1 hypothetical protein [Wenyingzhuangia aestuarii]